MGQYAKISVAPIETTCFECSVEVEIRYVEVEIHVFLNRPHVSIRFSCQKYPGATDQALVAQKTFTPVIPPPILFF